MDRIDERISNTSKRIAAITELARWIWCVNAIVMIMGVAHKRFDIAALAAFTWVLAMVVAAFGKKVYRSLIVLERRAQLSEMNGTQEGGIAA